MKICPAHSGKDCGCEAKPPQSLHFVLQPDLPGLGGSLGCLPHHRQKMLLQMLWVVTAGILWDTARLQLCKAARAP